MHNRLVIVAQIEVTRFQNHRPADNIELKNWHNWIGTRTVVLTNDRYLNPVSDAWYASPNRANDRDDQIRVAVGPYGTTTLSRLP